MIKRIVVPTDLSANSAAGVRFAIQLASQDKSVLLIFFHTINLIKPTRWADLKFENYVATETARAHRALKKFVAKYLKHGVSKKKNIEYVVQHGSDVQESIKVYTLDKKADAICMSTRGAGRLKKIIGTNSSAILTSSRVPVFVIPQTFRRKPITNILYSSDLENTREELAKVRDISKALRAKIQVVHYDYLYDIEEAKAKLEKAVKPFKGQGIKFDFRKLNIEFSLSHQLMRHARKSKASLVVLFTNQKRGWFDRLFLSSKSAEISFDSKLPLLVFPKK